MRLRVWEPHLKYYPENIQKKVRRVDAVASRLNLEVVTFECDIEWWELPSPTYCLYRTHADHRMGHVREHQRCIGATKDWDALYLVLIDKKTSEEDGRLCFE